MTWTRISSETVIVEINPSGIYGKQRHRHGIDSRGKARGFSSPTEKAREQEIASEFILQAGTAKSEFDGELHVTIDVQRSCPKGTPKYRQGEPDTYKPDADNISKLVLDALNGIAWKDDSQVTVLTVRKHPRYIRRLPYMSIKIEYVHNICEREDRENDNSN